MAGIKEYGPWSESIWEGVDCTVVEIERKEQDNDSNDMDVKENEDDAANQSPRFQRADKLFEANFRTDHNFHHLKINFHSM